MLCCMQVAVQTEMHAFDGVSASWGMRIWGVSTCTHHEYLDGLVPAHVQNLLAIPKELAGSALCITAMQTTRHVTTCSQHFLSASV